jgi:hypothetical protein
MHEAGLDNHEILVCATRNGAALVGREKELGTVEVGKLADLVLLNSNPLEDIGNTADIALVMKDGKLFDPDTLITPTPSELAQMQLNAYNARALDAFLEVYSPDVEIFSFPNTPIYKGIEQMRSVYGELFRLSDGLHCRLVNRVTYKNTVIDREIVKGVPRQKTIEAVAIYEIEDGLIRKVWFIQ